MRKQVLTQRGVTPTGVKLYKYIPGLINWVLSCPKDYINSFIEDAIKISEQGNQDYISFNPLYVWITEHLLEDIKSFSPIGNNRSSNNTLYGCYLQWCAINGVESIKFTQFSTLLRDQLKQMGWNVNKKRISSGIILQGVSLKTKNEKDLVIVPNKETNRDYNLFLEEFNY
jgi:hypothetical protein